MKSPSAPASPFRDSRWIWPDSNYWDLHNSYALFRRKFDLPKVPARAPFFITADQAYQLYINGRFVCRGPARGFQSHWPYDEIDVASYLKKGRNILAIRAYNPGFSTFQYITQGFAGLLVAARWNGVEIHTDEKTWKSRRQRNVSGDTVPTSVQLFPQEHIDLREEPAGDWTSWQYDDSDWKETSGVVWNSMPWFSLEPRGIPMLSERDMVPAAVLGMQEGKCAPGYQRTRDVVTLRFQEDRTHRPAKGPFKPLKIAATGKGKFHSYLFDFGKTVVGNLLFEAAGAHGGEIIDTYHVESIDRENLLPDLAIPTYCRMAFGDRIYARAGNWWHRFFHFYGFRYLVITVRDVEKDFTLNFRLNWVAYPLERKGLFQSSDKDLEKIWETCAWTQQCCSLDAYVDTPWREQAQWWGDARVQARNTFYYSGDARLFRRGLAQIAAQTTPDGVTYGHAPTMAHNCILPDFTLIWMLTIWDYYWQTGSVEPLLAHHGTVQRALDYFRQHTDPRSGLITHDSRYWNFLDWTDIFKDGAPTVYNLWLLLALDKLAALYRLARQPKEAAPLEAWAARLRVALRRLIGQDGLLSDGRDWKGKIVAETSIHSQVLASMTGLTGANFQTAIDRLILPFLREESDPKAKPGAYWITYLFSELIEHGYEKDVLAFIRLRWLPWVDQGSTSEHFQGAFGDGTKSHAWSAHPLFHLMNTIGGIRQTGPAWSEISFRPYFLGADAITVVPSPHGPIRSEWKRSGDQIKVKLQLPPGVKARVQLPGIKSVTVTGSKSWTLLAPK